MRIYQNEDLIVEFNGENYIVKTLSSSGLINGEIMLTKKEIQKVYLVFKMNELEEE